MINLFLHWFVNDIHIVSCNTVVLQKEVQTFKKIIGSRILNGFIKLGLMEDGLQYFCDFFRIFMNEANFGKFDLTKIRSLQNSLKGLKHSIKSSKISHTAN